MALPLLLLGAGIGAAQAASGLIPTKADKERKREIASLEASNGLSDAEAAAMAEELLGPARRAESEQRDDQASLLAATGSTSGRALQGSAEAVARGQALTRDLISRQVAAADADQKRRDEQRLADLRAERAADMTADRASVVQGLGSVAGAVGAEVASIPRPQQAIVQTLVESGGLPAADARALMKLTGGTEEGVLDMLRKASEGNAPDDVAEILRRAGYDL